MKKSLLKLGPFSLFLVSYLRIVCLSWTVATGNRPEVCVTSHEMLFHLSQVPVSLHSQLLLQHKDHCLKGLLDISALLDIIQWREVAGIGQRLWFARSELHQWDHKLPWHDKWLCVGSESLLSNGISLTAVVAEHSLGSFTTCNLTANIHRNKCTH